MRKCSTCKIDKEIEEFDFRSRKEGTRQWSCRVCSNKRSANHYRKNKEKYLKRKQERKRSKQKWMLEYFRLNPCDCGESHPAALDFDHIRDKKFNVSKMISGGHALKKIQEEIKKCVVRCANCHRKKTALDYGWYSAVEALK